MIQKKLSAAQSRNSLPVIGSKIKETLSTMIRTIKIKNKKTLLLLLVPLIFLNIFLQFLLFMMTNLFTSMWVDVEGELRTRTRNSKGGRGIITELNDNNIPVKYLLSNLMSPSVKASRIRPADLILSGRRKSRNGTATPSLLSHLYGEYRSQQLTQQSQEDEERVVDLQ